MHVLVVPSWYPLAPGDISGSFFREQAIALRKSGNKVGVIAPGVASWKAPMSFLRALQNPTYELDEGVATYRSSAISWAPRVPYLSAEIWIRNGLKLFSRYVRENGTPDVLHAHSLLYGGVLSQRISETFGIPFVLTEHSSAYQRGKVLSWQLRMAEMAVSKAKICVAVSESFAQYLELLFAGGCRLWRVLPNIVHLNFASAMSGHSPPLDGVFDFCSVSMLTRNKRVDNLLQAFGAAFQNREDVRLTIGGDGPDRDRLEMLIRELGLVRKVRMLGHLTRDEVVATMAKSHAYVLASKVETFGVVLVEALALGKPVIATRCGGPDSIVRMEDGLLVETDNVEALSIAMQALHASYAQYDASEIRSSCIERFGEVQVIEKLNAMYEEALGES